MAKDDTEDDEGDEPLTEINVDLEPSIVSIVTVMRPGAGAPSSESAASAADSEPSTLEPQLSVRGLGLSPGHVPGSVGSPAASGRHEHDDEHTTGSIDARLLEAYGSGRAVDDAVTQPTAGHLPIVITPSEPFRVTAAQISEKPRSSEATTPRRADLIPAAGTPPEADPDMGEPTVKRAPYRLGRRTFDEGAYSASTEDAEDAEDAEDVEDDTVTDAMRTRRNESAEEISQSEVAPAAADEEDETRTQHDVSRGLRALGAEGMIGSRPAATRDRVGLEEARTATPEGKSPSGGQSGPGSRGATIRMLFNASLGAVTINPGTRDGGSAPYKSPEPEHMPRAHGPFAPAPTLAHMPDAQASAPPPPPPTVRRPPTPRFDPLAKPKRKGGRKLFFFLIFVAASGGGSYYRHRVAPWVMKHLPASFRPSTRPPPVAILPSAAPDPSASPSASASASASASPSAALSSSAAHGKKRPKK